MASVSLAAHAGLPFMNPLSEEAIDGAIAALQLAPGARVVETGCGAAEVLLRVLERHPEATGVAVDPDGDALLRAAMAARARVPGREPELLAAPADDAGLPAGAFDLVINVAASHAHGGFPEALDALAALAAPGGAVLLGEGFWTREPSPAFLEALGGATADELPLGLQALEGAARAAGLEVVARAEASEDDWAAYEEGLAANAEALGTPDGDAYARRIRERRALPGGGSTMGFALLTLRKI
jgi:trans-aconitate methyltransferase